MPASPSARVEGDSVSGEAAPHTRNFHTDVCNNSDRSIVDVQPPVLARPLGTIRITLRFLYWFSGKDRANDASSQACIEIGARVSDEVTVTCYDIENDEDQNI